MAREIIEKGKYQLEEFLKTPIGELDLKRLTPEQALLMVGKALKVHSTGRVNNIYSNEEIGKFAKIANNQPL